MSLTNLENPWTFMHQVEGFLPSLSKRLLHILKWTNCLREIDDRTDTTITNCLPIDVYAHVRVARSPSQACSFVNVSSLPSLLRFSNAYENHTWWYSRLFCARLSLTISFVKGEDSAAGPLTWKLQVSWIYWWTWVGAVDGSVFFFKCSFSRWFYR